MDDWDEDVQQFYKDHEKKLQKHKDKLAPLFQDYDSLINVTLEELISEFKLAKYEAKIVFKCISQEKHDDEIINKQDQPTERKPFDINLTVGKTHYTITNVTTETTIEYIKRQISLKSRSTEKYYTEFTISFPNFSEVKDNQKLGDFNITDGVMGSEMMSVISQLDGGTSNEHEKKQIKKQQYRSIWTHSRSRRLRKKKYPFLKPVKAVCDVFLCGEEDCNKMPCGHNVSTMSCFSLVKRLLEKDFKSYELKCPVLKQNSSKKIEYCNKVWSWDIVRAVADLDDDEFRKVMEIIKNRNLKLSTDTKKCPHKECQRLCGRPDRERVGIFRVACKCRRGDWCWHCGQLWKASGFTICGNKKCRTWQKQVDLLTCGPCYQPGDISYEYKDKIIPKIRACPNCFTVIYHKKACKHMKCKFCRRGNGQDFEFCFLCLDVKTEKGTWEKCFNSEHWKFCRVAGVQLLGGSGLDYPAIGDDLKSIGTIVV